MNDIYKFLSFYYKYESNNPSYIIDNYKTISFPSLLTIYCVIEKNLEKYLYTYECVDFDVNDLHLITSIVKSFIDIPPNSLQISKSIIKLARIELLLI